jgi:hypothetical protein
MNETQIYIASAIALIVVFGILYVVIESASRSKQISQQLTVQNRLLEIIAKHKGADETEIKKAFEKN